MSLVELLVSTALVGIIMVGVVSVDYATRMSQQKASRSGLVAMHTSTTMLEIVQKANITNGIQSVNNSRCVICVNTSDCCFRQDSSNTPALYTDDTFACYTKIGTNIYKCTRASAGSCVGTDPLLGTAVSLDISLVQDNTLANQTFYISIALSDRYNAAAAAGMTNPQIDLTTRVFPGTCSY